MKAEIKSKHKIQGSSRVWEVAEWDDGHYSCNCPAWIFHKGQKVDCKHILEFKHQNSNETTFRIESVKNEAQKDDMNKENELVNDLLFKTRGGLSSI